MSRMRSPVASRLELGKRQKHIQRQPPHAARSVELLGDRNEGDAVAIKDLDEPRKIGEGAHQPVDLVKLEKTRDLGFHGLGEQGSCALPQHLGQCIAKLLAEPA